MAIYDEKFAKISDYGEINITRASMVEYHNGRKEWLVYVPTTPVDKYAVHWTFWDVVASAPTREEAIAKEIAYLENKYRCTILQGDVLVHSTG